MIKIAVIGPESTGKTELCQRLAGHFDAEWVPELAREYVEQRGNTYNFDDVVQIARLQIEQENKYKNRTEEGFIFFDTDLIITKVWFQHKYNVLPEFVNQRVNERFYNFYLLCVPDLPWEYDPVRENGDNRDFFFDWYEREIQALEIPYAIIDGVGKKRVDNAIQAVLKAKREITLVKTNVK